VKASYVVIPVREFRTTKLRLGAGLGPRERAALTSALLRNILTEIEKSKANEAIVVASSPRMISKLLSKFQKARVVKESRHHGGVDSAMEDGLKAIRQDGGSVLLIPSDLPLIRASALNDVIALAAKYDVLINPSAKLDGTNLLAFDLQGGRIPFHYDDDSFRKHLLEAKRLRRKYRVLRMPEFSFDVDSDEDLKKLMKQRHARSFAELLKKINGGLQK
jgi:2-phospho-L-lactate guanylyltransferase